MVNAYTSSLFPAYEYQFTLEKLVQRGIAPEETPHITTTESTSMTDVNVVLKRFDNPDELREFEKGKFELVTLRGMTIGRATYQPGWKWSEDVGSAMNEAYCHVEHVGMVVSGSATAAMANGEIVEMTPGDLFYVPPSPHDSWVIGDEPYVSLHFMGAAGYAKKGT